LCWGLNPGPCSTISHMFGPLLCRHLIKILYRTKRGMDEWWKYWCLGVEFVNDPGCLFLYLSPLPFLCKTTVLSRVG
jgi:hypothetical protein